LGKATELHTGISAGKFHSRSGGFTLVEVIAAMTIMAVGVTVILSSFIEMNQVYSLREKRTEAISHARTVIAMVRNQSLSPDSEEKSGVIEETDYRYETTFTKTDWTGLYAVQVQIQWGESDSPGSIALDTLQFYD